MIGTPPLSMHPAAEITAVEREPKAADAAGGEMELESSYQVGVLSRLFYGLLGYPTPRAAPTPPKPQDALPCKGVVGRGQLHDAEVEPAVPEATVAAVGDATGQHFLPPSLSRRGFSDEYSGVSLSDFDSIKVLGKGSFGKVLLVQKTEGAGKHYAMKVLKKAKLKRPKQIERTKTERRVLELSKDHPFIMSMSFAFQTPARLYIVLEYCPGGELFFHLSRFRKFPEQVARFYVAELTCALDFLHQHGVIYRDLKPENVLLDAEGHVKLGDFGLAKDNIWSATTGAKSVCGTPEYMPPEVLNKIGHGHAVDWWGLGMILYEMLTGLPPWYTKDRQKLFQRLRFAPLRIPPTMSLPCASCVSSLLCREPADRLGARGGVEVRQHAFFACEPKFDWTALEERRVPPPISPMEGHGKTSDPLATGNFDPQFTGLAIDTEGEEDHPRAAEPTYEHFLGFSFVGSVDEDLPTPPPSPTTAAPAGRPESPPPPPPPETTPPPLHQPNAPPAVTDQPGAGDTHRTAASGLLPAGHLRS